MLYEVITSEEAVEEASDELVVFPQAANVVAAKATHVKVNSIFLIFINKSSFLLWYNDNFFM